MSGSLRPYFQSALVITPDHLPMVMEDLGTEIMIDTGGGIHAFPAENGGPSAGARVFRQGIDASAKRISMKDYAEYHPELKVALDR